jgi:hypothetical protein
LSVFIRKGFSASQTETDRVDKLKKLEALGVLQLETEKVQYCKCRERHKVEGAFLDDRRVICSCGRNIISSKKAEVVEYVVKQINYDKVISICNELLTKNLGESNCLFDDKQRCWNCTWNGKTVSIFILEVSSYNQCLDFTPESDSCWLSIVLDWETERFRINYYNELHFVKVEDFLGSTFRVNDRMDQLTSSFDSNISAELAIKYDVFVSKVSASRFEQEFIDSFLAGIRAKADKLSRYFGFLSARKNTILNSKVIILGGPGNPDFITLPLLEYLQEGLKPDKIGEAKRYRKSVFTFNDFSLAMGHADENDTVCIASTNKIKPEVWRRIIEKREKVGYYKHVVIERDTILLLIRVLGLENLLPSV